MTESLLIVLKIKEKLDYYFYVSFLLKVYNFLSIFYMYTCKSELELIDILFVILKYFGLNNSLVK